MLLALAVYNEVEAHRPGEEFSYLSMFLERDVASSEMGLDDLYKTYASKPPGSSRKTRRLHHVNKPTQNAAREAFLDEFDEEQIDPDAIERSVRAAAAAAIKPTQDPIPSIEVAPATTSPTTAEIGTDMPLSLAMQHGEDIQRLSEMLTKLIRQYQITSLVDVPCRAHAHWMPQVLRDLSGRGNSQPVANFRYICVDTNQEVLSFLRKRLVENNVHRGSRFVLRKFWKEGIPQGDMVFSWAGLDNMSEGNVLGFFRRLATSKGKHKLVVIGSHSGELVKKGDPDKIARFTSSGHPINVRKEPFSLAKPGRIIKDMSTNGNDKQMYIYYPEKMFPSKDNKND